MKCLKRNCRAPALNNDNHCYFHSANVSAIDKRKARSKGGKTKLIKVNCKYDNYKLRSTNDILSFNEMLINDLLQNKISLKLITGIAYNLTLQFRLLQFNSIGNKLSEYELERLRILAIQEMKNNIQIVFNYLLRLQLQTLIKIMKKVIAKKENKEYVFRLRMNNEELKKLEKLSKILKVKNSQTVRILIDNKITELRKQKDIFE